MERGVPIGLERPRAFRPNAHILGFLQHRWPRNIQFLGSGKVLVVRLPFRGKRSGIRFARSYFLPFLDRIFMRRGSKSKRRSGIPRIFRGFPAEFRLCPFAITVICPPALGGFVHRNSGGIPTRGVRREFCCSNGKHNALGGQTRRKHLLHHVGNRCQAVLAASLNHAAPEPIFVSRSFWPLAPTLRRAVALGLPFWRPCSCVL